MNEIVPKIIKKFKYILKVEAFKQNLKKFNKVLLENYKTVENLLREKNCEKIDLK
jgi:hypothetical protein